MVFKMNPIHLHLTICGEADFTPWSNKSMAGESGLGVKELISGGLSFTWYGMGTKIETVSGIPKLYLKRLLGWGLYEY